MQQLITASDLTSIPADNGIAEVIHIAVLADKIGDVIVFIIDQIKLGHRATLVNSLGESLISKIEKL